jgi:hypothetical protein
MDQLRLFKLKHDLLKISVDLQIAFAADTHLAEGKWLKFTSLPLYPRGSRPRYSFYRRRNINQKYILEEIKSRFG